MTPIELLRLDHRPYYALLRFDITTIEQLLAMTEAELLDVKGIGPTGCYIIQTALASRGLALKHESPVRDLRRTNGTLASRGA